MATLIENLVGRGLNVEDYAFQARKFFCQPSKRTLALAEKVLARLEDELYAKIEEQEWINFCESGGYEEYTAGLEEWDY